MRLFPPICSVFLWTLAFLLPGASGARVLINEVQSSNDATCFDEDESSSDWLELYNDGTEAVDLAGWGLSDKAKKPFKWVFPHGLSLGAQQHLLVFASGKDRTNLVAAVQEVVPNQVKGLCLWLRGDDVMTSSTVRHGSTVRQWTDASGMGNHATQQTRTFRPTVFTNAVNGHVALKFDHGSYQMFYLPTNFNGMASLSNASVYVISKWNGTSATSGLFGQWASSSQTANSHFEIQSGGLVRWRVGGVDLKSANNAVVKDEWTMLAGFTQMSREAPLVSLYKDSNLLVSADKSVGSVSFKQADCLYIGNSCDRPGSTSMRGFDGLIAEVAIFDHALTHAERAGVEEYFRRKYFRSSPPALHTNFSLGGDGETLVLTQPDGTTADTVTFGKVPCDTSWGRLPDGGETFGWFSVPTPGDGNVGPLHDAPLAPVSFSPERGVYTAPLTVTLSHPDPEATIYYTLDHSDPSASHGTVYTGTPIPVAKSTFIRATAVKTGHIPYRNIMTHSYLFLADATVNPGIPDGFPSKWTTGSSSSPAVYGVSSNVVRTTAQKAALVQALSSVPILSVVLPDDDLFGADNGVYTNPTEEDLEAAASCEWIGTNGVGRIQLDAGLRAQGAASRNFGSQAKKSFRLCFRGRYGAGSLAEPVLDDVGCPLASFNTLVLRAEYNNSWTHSQADQRLRGTNMRDQFMRDLFRDMGQPGAYGTHVHLFLNGYYWGLYNVTERPDATYGELYFGGRKDEWDVIKAKVGGAEVRDGDAAAWDAMYAATANQIATAAGYAALTNLLDVVNFADYMLLNHWGGNQDWPGNNWAAMRRRADGERFRFCAWDEERTLEGVGDNRLDATDVYPGKIHSRLLAVPDYKALYARRARRHFHPRHGLLAPTNTVSRWERMCAEVEPGIFGEAARWGNYRKEAGNTSTTYGLATWQAERERVRDVYLPARTTNFIAKAKSKGLWVDPDPDEEAVFVQDDKGNWDNDDNWSTGVYPDLPGARARVDAPSANGVDAAKGWRNLRLKDHDVHVGRLTFRNGAFTNRVCNKDAAVAGRNYGVVFNGGTNGAPAVLRVADLSGGGQTLFDNDYATHLATDLRVIVDNPEGSPTYGALRLQQTWVGPGAFIKEGPGRCSLTGAGKNWTGGTRVRAGLLSATAKSFPPGTVTLEPGGRFLVVGATHLDKVLYRARFELDGSSLDNPARLHLWIRETSDGLLFSALVADPATFITIK